jgi:hypothetical protein
MEAFNMIKYVPVNAVRVDKPSWPGFYVLIVSNSDDTERAVYLTHEKIGVIHYLYGVCKQSDGSMETIEETAEIAYLNMEDYLPDFVRDCCNDEIE